MNKQIFLEQLSKQLKSLPHDEREEILQDYVEYFAAAEAEGKTEQQIIHGLGSPKQISKELLAAYHIDTISTTSSISNILRAIWAVVGLSFFNIIVVLAPAVGAFGIILAGWLTGISFLLTPILFIINIIIFPDTFVLFDLFFVLFICSIGYFLLIGISRATKFFTKLIARYLKFNVTFLKKRGAA